MNIFDHYQTLLKNTEIVLKTMAETKNASEALTASHNFIVDFDVFKIAISDRPEVAVLDSAVKEYQLALFALASGQYRHAFVGLRLFFELMLATIQFSAHEIDYRMWAKDTKDINWSSLKDNQNGVFSVSFIRAFSPAFSEIGKQFSAIAEAVYRECSEFVHGNAGTHVKLPSDITFHEESFFSWHQKASTMRLVIIFIYTARYINYITDESKNKLELVIMDAIGYLPVVQEIFSTPSVSK
jgi:hypothetical protein